MPILESDIKEKISKAFPSAEFKITDLAGDGDHYQLHIKAVEFKGLTKIAQHKLVYAALSDCIGGQLHALALKTEELNEEIS